MKREKTGDVKYKETTFTFTFFLLIQLSLQVHFNPSPCPRIFTYEDGDGDVATDDRWYGNIELKIDSITEGSTLHITLDRASQLLVSWSGEAITNDNIVYILTHTAILNKGSTHKLKIMVKFDNDMPVPMLKSIRFNSRQICPAVTALGSIEESSSSSRPDPAFTSPTSDIISDINRKTTTDRSTTRRTTIDSSRKTSTTTRRSSVDKEEDASNFYRPNTSNNNDRVECGSVSVVNPLVTNGQRTHHGQWPWHIALYKTESINLNYICGGSLISKNKVITAAHCLLSSPGNHVVNTKTLVVYLGKYNLRQYSGETGVQTKEVIRLNIYPGYNGTTFHGDIAILTLSSDVEFTSYVRPVCIWEQENNIANVVGKQGVVAGWGFNEFEQPSEELKMASLPVISTEHCFRSYPKFYSEFLSENAFCAGFNNGTSPCNGDSGGGLVFKRNLTWYLRGIVSLSVAKEGLNFCNPDYYVIFTDVAKYTDFIRKSTS